MTPGTATTRTARSVRSAGLAAVAATVVLLAGCSAAAAPASSQAQPPMRPAVHAAAAPAAAAPAAAVPAAKKENKKRKKRGIWSGKVRAYGDSVMLGAKTALKKRLKAKVSAAISRQSWTVLGKVNKAAKRGTIRGPVVIHTGTNGTVERSLLLKTARKVKTIIVLVTAKANRSWVAGVNSTLRSVAGQRGDVVLFDWAGHSRGHGSWFGPDGIHLTSSGAKAYANGIAKTLRR